MARMLDQVTHSVKFLLASPTEIGQRLMSLEQLIRLEEIIAVNTFGRLMTDFVTIELDDFDVLIYSFAQGLGNTAFFNLVGANMLL